MNWKCFSVLINKQTKNELTSVEGGYCHTQTGEGEEAETDVGNPLSLQLLVHLGQPAGVGHHQGSDPLVSGGVPQVRGGPVHLQLS